MVPEHIPPHDAFSDDDGGFLAFGDDPSPAVSEQDSAGELEEMDPVERVAQMSSRTSLPYGNFFHLIHFCQIA